MVQDPGAAYEQVARCLRAAQDSNLAAACLVLLLIRLLTLRMITSTPVISRNLRILKLQQSSSHLAGSSRLLYRFDRRLACANQVAVPDANGGSQGVLHASPSGVEARGPSSSNPAAWPAGLGCSWYKPGS